MVEGVVQAASQRTALDELHRQQLYPVNLEQVDAQAERRRRAGAANALAVFARTLATMLGAGVPLDRALAFGAEQVRHPTVAAAARQLRVDVQGGASLAEAMRRQPSAFGPVVIAMVASGEESGALDLVMARLADHLDELAELKSQVRASLLYPTFMAVAAGVGITVLLLFVVPRFVSMLDQVGGTLPLSTRILVGASAIVTGWWWLLLVLGALLAIAARWWLARSENRQRWHAARLGWPLVGELELAYVTARYARALGMLLASGRSVLPSLRVARSAVTNLELGARFDRATEAVSQGQRLHVALAGTLPPLACELMAVGEESGKLDELCVRIADSYDNDVRRALRSLVGIIEPSLILLFAVVVGFVALAMLQAIYSLNASVL